MRGLFVAFALSIAASLPLSAYAQPASPPLQPVSQHVAVGMDGKQVLVIAAGAIVGATLIGSPFRRGATLIGAVAGGLLANWWYERAEPLALDPARKGL
jgi:hypothetical protein